MGIPNTKKYRPYCPTCKDSFTVVAILPKGVDIDQYLADVVSRHDHKAFEDQKKAQFKIRVGQQKQKKAK